VVELVVEVDVDDVTPGGSVLVVDVVAPGANDVDVDEPPPGIEVVVDGDDGTHRLPSTSRP